MTRHLSTPSRKGGGLSLRSLALVLLTLCLFAASTATAQAPAEAAADATTETATETSQATALSYLDDLPPLLDRQLFFGNPEIASSQISPDGAWVTFRKPYRDVMNIWIKGIDEPFDAARPLTADDRPVPGYFWSMDSKYVLYVQDKGGNENFHVYAVDPSAEPEKESGVPPARDLTPMDGVRAQIFAVPEATPQKILVGLNDRDPALHDVYRLDLATGDLELLIENDANIAAWEADLEGNVRLAVRQGPDGGFQTLTVSPEGELGEVIYSCSWKESCGPTRFHKDGKHVYFVSNKGEDVDLTSLYLMDAATGETELVESDPENEVDFGGAMFSNATDELLATAYVGDRVRIYPKTEKMKQALAFLESELPDGEIGFSPQTSDDRLVKVTVGRDVDPGTVYLYDWEKNTVEKLYETRPELPTEHLAPMQPIRYAARDGLEIPAYLTTPKGIEAKDLALVVNPHGGPWSRDAWGYDSNAQFLANRGYAVLQINFRGSTGYGKEFLNAGNNEWGEAMQDDLSDGVLHLVEKGIVDPGRVCIMGGSYGGYATLAGLTFTPQHYTCGVDIVGPSNLITLINSIPPYWGPIRKLFEQRMGDPATDEGRAQLEAQSPLNSVDKIEDPLLVIQGANDPRVKQAEADQIVVAMREKNLPVEYIVAPDEGHGFRGEENRLAMFARVEEFLAEHLGGRYQEEMAPEVAERLAEITVDVATVEEPKKATGLDAAKTSPLPTVDAELVRRGTFGYRSTIQMQGQEMQLDATVELKEIEAGGGDVLRVKTVTESPMGSGTDSYVLDAESLRPRTRSVMQGPATIDVEFGKERVSGKISAGPQEIPIDIELEAPVYGGDVALETVLAALSLDEEYRTTLRSVEIGMAQRLRIWSLAVEGKEKVEVPAGTFETWKVAVSDLDGEGGAKTVWISTETPRVVVKTEGTLPAQMGGGQIVTELTELPGEEPEDGSGEG